MMSTHRSTPRFAPSLVLCLLVLLSGLSAPGIAAAEDPQAECTYTTYSWNTKERKSGPKTKVKKTRGELAADERSEDDPRCSICSEDQVKINPAELGWPKLPAFKICHVYADQMKTALKEIADSGSFKIKKISAYRVGRTRGKINAEGFRTQLSNHSYGTAIDINAKQNGLYGKCNVDDVNEESIQKCKLRVGGAWNPKRKKVTVVKDGVVYKAFAPFWKWGGEIKGNTKDMMHFSITGY